jgi:hypothetical protein
MTAAPFKAILVMVAKDGSNFNYPCTVSDVNAEYYVFPDGNNDVVLPSTHGVIYITDIILSAAGTDTSQATIWVNGKDTGEKIMNAANVGTVFNRQFMSSPIAISPSARLRIKQAT